MTLIKVDAAVLGVVAGHLTDASGIAQTIKDHQSQLTEHANNAGHPLVTEALSTFIGKWSYGCGCLLDDAHQTSGRLNAASTAYIHTDENVSRGGFHGE